MLDTKSEETCIGANSSLQLATGYKHLTHGLNIKPASCDGPYFYSVSLVVISDAAREIAFRTFVCNSQPADLLTATLIFNF
jgi:hypothetical protein